MSIVNSEMSAETNTDNAPKADDLTSSNNNTKPDVVGSKHPITTENLVAILGELNPILEELNNVLSNRKITEYYMTFYWDKDKLTFSCTCH